MVNTSITIKAPGSMMVLGEHAVLHDQPAIVTALNRWTELQLIVTNDEKITIDSNYGFVEWDIKQAPTEVWALWIHAIIQEYLNDYKILQQGLKIVIRSDFEGAIGLSSSTSVTVALLFALAHVLYGCYPGFDPGSSESSTNLIRSRVKPGMTKEAPGLAKQDWVFEQALLINKKHNKVASGAALQAIIYGGLRYFDSATKTSKLIEAPFPFYLVHCGYKTPTEQVVDQIQKQFSNNDEKLEAIYSQMGDVVKQAYVSLKENDYADFNSCINDYFKLQQQLGTSDDTLNQMIALANSSNKTKASKISGAGLGDCILVIGEVNKALWQSTPFTIISVQISTQGVHVC